MNRLDIDTDSQTWQKLAESMLERRGELIVALLSKDGGTPDDNKIRGKIAMLDELLTIGDEDDGPV